MIDFPEPKTKKGVPAPKSKEWKLIYNDNDYQRIKQVYWGSGFVYGSIVVFIGTYFYLTKYRPNEKINLLKQSTKDGIGPVVLLVVLKAALFTLLILRRRFLVLEIYKNVSNSNRFYLTRFNWLLMKKSVEFHKSDMKTLPTQSDNYWVKYLIDMYGNWSFRIGDKFRRMRLFDYQFTSVEDRMKFCAR